MEGSVDIYKEDKVWNYCVKRKKLMINDVEIIYFMILFMR